MASNPHHVSTTSLASLPTEITQQIAGCLSYQDAWSLKHTSSRFYAIVRIRTFQEHLRELYGERRATKDYRSINEGHLEPCSSCKRLRPLSNFRYHTAFDAVARGCNACSRGVATGPLAYSRRSTSRCYRCYPHKKGKSNPPPYEHQMCVECQVKRRIVRRGAKVKTFSSKAPGARCERLIVCRFCKTIVDRKDSCHSCQGKPIAKHSFRFLIRSDLPF